MSVFRFLPKHLKRRASRFRPKSFPDHYAYAAFFDVRAKLFDGDDMMVLEYPDRATQELLFRHAVEKFDLRDKKIIDLGCGLGYLKKYLDESVLGYRVGPDPEEYMKRLLREFFRINRVGIAFTHLAPGRRQDPTDFTYPPEAMVAWCKEELSERVVLDDWGGVTYVIAVYKGS
jgi:SAM-dependent methyltransferase